MSTTLLGSPSPEYDADCAGVLLCQELAPTCGTCACTLCAGGQCAQATCDDGGEGCR